jgi:hypothetical protein
MSDLGSYYLGMDVKQNSEEITLCQCAYAARIVEISGIKGCNLVDTPMEQHVKIVAGTEGSETNITTYRSIIGSLRYLVKTRSDLAYSVVYFDRKSTTGVVYFLEPNLVTWTVGPHKSKEW